ncbi:MAG: 50S ribosomal protein L6 [Oscillospiraceae bacterium]|nr:50S ribosomal protein L6 [Oscillospiraceae bacterium]
MSRIGRMPIAVPAGVDINVGEGNLVTVKGPKGTLTQALHPRMKLEKTETGWEVKRPSEQKSDKALHGLTRTLFNNMVTGVSAGFTKELEINGVGYRAAKQGKQLIMNLGFSHQVIFEESDDIKLEAPSPNKVIVSGCDRQKVGQFAAEIREKRPPEPYKGKGIKYVDEVIRRKEGKTGAKKK